MIRIECMWKKLVFKKSHLNTVWRIFFAIFLIHLSRAFPILIIFLWKLLIRLHEWTKCSWSLPVSIASSLVSCLNKNIFKMSMPLKKPTSMTNSLCEFRNKMKFRLLRNFWDLFLCDFEILSIIKWNEIIFYVTQNFCEIW
jgi:hypothetical protein